MATKIILENADGELKEGYIGFSYTTAIFGFLVPLFRGDLNYFILFLLAKFILVTNLKSIWVSELIVMIFFGYIYNKRYTINLIDKGYFPIDLFSIYSLSKNGYIEYINIYSEIYEEKLKMISLKERKKLLYFVIYKIIVLIVLNFFKI